MISDLQYCFCTCYKYTDNTEHSSIWTFTVPLQDSSFVFKVLVYQNRTQYYVVNKENEVGTKSATLQFTCTSVVTSHKTMLNCSVFVTQAFFRLPLFVSLHVRTIMQTQRMQTWEKCWLRSVQSSSDFIG